MQSIIVPLIEKRIQMQGVCVLVFVGWALTLTSVEMMNIRLSGWQLLTEAEKAENGGSWCKGAHSTPSGLALKDRPHSGRGTAIHCHLRSRPWLGTQSWKKVPAFLELTAVQVRYSVQELQNFYLSSRFCTCFNFV